MVRRRRFRPAPGSRTDRFSSSTAWSSRMAASPRLTMAIRSNSMVLMRDLPGRLTVPSSLAAAADRPIGPKVRGPGAVRHVLSDRERATVMS